MFLHYLKMLHIINGRVCIKYTKYLNKGAKLPEKSNHIKTSPATMYIWCDQIYHKGSNIDIKGAQSRFQSKPSCSSYDEPIGVMICKILGITGYLVLEKKILKQPTLF